MVFSHSRSFLDGQYEETAAFPEDGLVNSQFLTSLFFLDSQSGLTTISRKFLKEKKKKKGTFEYSSEHVYACLVFRAKNKESLCYRKETGGGRENSIFACSGAPTLGVHLHCW